MVCRPDSFTSAAEVLMTPPAEVIAKTSSSGWTMSAPTSSPRASTILAVKHAPATPALQRVLVSRGALGVSSDGRDHHVGALTNHVHAEQFVAIRKSHPNHAGRGPAHRAQRLVGGMEPDRLGLPAHQQEIIFRRDQPRRDDLVIFTQVDRDDAAGPGESKSVSCDFFTSPDRVARTR